MTNEQLKAFSTVVDYVTRMVLDVRADTKAIRILIAKANERTTKNNNHLRNRIFALKGEVAKLKAENKELHLFKFESK